MLIFVLFPNNLFLLLQFFYVTFSSELVSNFVSKSEWPPIGAWVFQRVQVKTQLCTGWKLCRQLHGPEGGGVLLLGASPQMVLQLRCLVAHSTLVLFWWKMSTCIMHWWRQISLVSCMCCSFELTSEEWKTYFTSVYFCTTSLGSRLRRVTHPHQPQPLPHQLTPPDQVTPSPSLCLYWLY